MFETWTCDYCRTVYHSADEYTNCQCLEMSAFRAGRNAERHCAANDTRDAAGHQLSAQREARDRGMAFIVDGKHIPADRVFILSVPDTVGPISSMRKAKVDALAALHSYEDYDKFRSHSVTLNTVLVKMADYLGMVFDDHGAAEVDVELLIERFFGKVGRVPHQCTSPKGGFACRGCTCGAPRKGMAASSAPNELPAPINWDNCQAASGGAKCVSWCGNAACVAPVVIDGIVVTDPDLANPITDELPGVTSMCFECGKPCPNTPDDFPVFCDDHANSR